ncbi:MAG: hypothetical protein JWR63_1990 [Conexibacter sp.]|nr:hypothetical protein [Conexibacter sp.]
MLYLRAQAEGDWFNENYRPKAAENNDCNFDALVRLHARACRVASEARALLRTGHADGAHARSRTLHEIAVTAFFIRTQGGEVGECYLLHANATAYKAARQFQQHAERLGAEPLTENEMDHMRQRRDALVERFGASYVEDYGWAAATLDKSRPTFYDLERAADMEHWRPHFKWASEGVHAGLAASRTRSG